MEHKYFKLEHSNPSHKDWFVVNWCLGNTCNFACSYCPSGLHDGSKRWPDPQLIKNFIAKVGSTDLDVATLNEVEKVTKNIIADVDVAGYAVSEAEVFPDGTQYRAFVLLEYNDLEANKIIVTVTFNTSNSDTQYVSFLTDYTLDISLAALIKYKFITTRSFNSPFFKFFIKIIYLIIDII